MQWSMDEPLGTLERLRALAANSLVVAILSPFFLLTAGWVQRVLLAVIILDIPLQLSIGAFYRPVDAWYGAEGGLSISVTTMALALLYASWFVRVLARKEREASPRVHINLPLTLYLGFTALSLFAARDIILSLFDLFLLLQMYLVYVYVANFVETRQDLLFVVSLLMIGCLLESLVMITLRFTGLPASLAWLGGSHLHVQARESDGAVRIGGTVGAANDAGAYLSLILAPAAGLLLARLGRAHKLLALAVLGLGGAALIFTFSRGGWIAFGLSITLLFLFAIGRRGISLKAPISVIVILALLYLPFQGVISERLFSDDRGSAESRIPLMKLAFRIIEDNPVLGVGSNNFHLVMNRYVTSEFRSGFLYTVHNKYMLIWAETGLGALLAYLAFILGTLRKGWQCWKLSNPLLSSLALGFTAAIAGHMVHMGAEILRGRAVIQLLWLTAGLLAAIHRLSKQPLSSDSLSPIT